MQSEFTKTNDSEYRSFKLEHLVSSYSGIIFDQEDGEAKIKELLSFLIGFDIEISQTTSEFCKPYIEDQFPHIVNITNELGNSLLKADDEFDEQAILVMWLNSFDDVKALLRPLKTNEQISVLTSINTAGDTLHKLNV